MADRSSIILSVSMNICVNMIQLRFSVLCLFVIGHDQADGGCDYAEVQERGFGIIEELA